MYLERLKITHLKLMADFDMSFETDGSPRMWTVFLGENGCCKSTLLQAIALAATGPEQGNTLAGDIRPSLRDKRSPFDGHAAAWFSFSDRHHGQREYPGLAARGPRPPALRSEISLPASTDVVRGESSFWEGTTPVGTGDPLREVRAKGTAHWFCAGYGVARTVVVPQSTIADSRVPAVDRLRSLFDARHALIGPDFISRFAGDEAREFAVRLREALVDHGILPAIRAFDLRGRGGVSKTEALVEAHRFDQAFDDGPDVRLPATWLSHGYQSTISWVADLIGQILLEAKTTSVPLDEMEGLVLVDELDLHLHPRWQRQLVESLRRAFPRLQFICTTHSPMVLPALRAEEVFVLRQGKGGDVGVVPASASPALMTGSELLDSFFDVESTKSRELRAKIDEYGTLLFATSRTPEEQMRLESMRQDLKKAGVELPWEDDRDKALAGQ